jgi:hypothetical protein
MESDKANRGHLQKHFGHSVLPRLTASKEKGSLRKTNINCLNSYHKTLKKVLNLLKNEPEVVEASKVLNDQQ